MASASTARADEAAAAAMFDRGLAAMMAGELEKACPMLAESFRLDPRAGSLFTLAECEAKLGKSASALVHYQDYLVRFDGLSAREQARQGQRRELAVKQVEALKSTVAELTVRVPPNAPPTGVVKRDGAVQGPPALGVALPIDPGLHTVVTDNGAGKTREVQLVLSPGEKKEITVEFAPVDATREPDPGSGARRAPPGPMWPIYTTVGVGAAGVIVGSVFGGLTYSKKDTIDTHCPQRRCDAEGRKAVDSAATTSLVSTIGFGVGAAGLVAGAILWAIRPSDRPSGTDTSRATWPTLTPLPGGAGLSMTRTF